MNIIEKKLENSSFELQIDLPQERVDLEYAAVFDQIARSTKIDGFRKGKAPLELIKKMYKEEAAREVQKNLLTSVFIDAVTEKKLFPINEPRYEFDKIVQGTPFSFKAFFDVPPTVEIGKYKEIPVNEKICEITNSDVEFEIDSIRENHAIVNPKEEGAQIENGNLVSMRVRRIEEDQTAKGDAREYTIVVGKSRDESALDKRILGMKAGEERDVEVKYPKDHAITELAGQKVRYSVTIIDIKAMALPDLTDDFAKNLQYASIEDFRKTVRENLERFSAEKTRAEAKSEILKSIVENSRFDLPVSLINVEMIGIFQKHQEKFGLSGKGLEEFASLLKMQPEEYRKHLRQEGEMSVKTMLVLLEIAKKEELKVPDERYNEVVETIAKKNGKTKIEIEELIEKTDSKKKILSELTFDITMNFIYENAKIKKMKPISLEELLR